MRADESRSQTKSNITMTNEIGSTKKVTIFPKTATQNFERRIRQRVFPLHAKQSSPSAVSKTRKPQLPQHSFRNSFNYPTNSIKTKSPQRNYYSQNAIKESANSSKNAPSSRGFQTTMKRPIPLPSNGKRTNVSKESVGEPRSVRSRNNDPKFDKTFKLSETHVVKVERATNNRTFGVKKNTVQLQKSPQLALVPRTIPSRGSRNMAKGPESPVKHTGLPTKRNNFGPARKSMISAMTAYPSDIKAASKLKFGHKRLSNDGPSQFRSNAIVPKLLGRMPQTTNPTPNGKTTK